MEGIMKFYIGITDKNWYSQLKAQRPEEVNFWKPGSSNFRVLQQNELFLFKLHAPANYIVGGGFFVRFSLLPPFLAWQAFGENNGTRSYNELLDRINRYRSRNSIGAETSAIGCIILTEPFFFDECDWIPAPTDWSNSIVQGKTYDSQSEIGSNIYQQVMEHLQGNHSDLPGEQNTPRYAEGTSKHRLGQGAFRVIVTDAYQRRCAISGEKTLPVLVAAHIKPYALDGPHETQNGILLRSDIHTLFDDGYMTITPDLYIEVSKHLHDDYGNGKDYYKYHGNKLLILPEYIADQPSAQYLSWHNESCFRG